MAVNLVKLCVGATSVEDLEHWSAQRLAAMRKAGTRAELFHTTRMVPKRADELVAGGSLYWVIAGSIQCRQTLTTIEPFVDGDGIGRCRLMLGPKIVRTRWMPKRPFQGWRYLKAEEAPADLAAGETQVPAELRADLAELGLL